jgi:hypothetical protein
MRNSVQDRLGHEIYLTDERWHHICEEHLEMQASRRHVLETVRRGRRFQDRAYFHYDRLPDSPAKEIGADETRPDHLRP